MTNINQLECITSTEGKYLVLAGPGTGKTYTITERIRYMIEEKHIEPDHILCLTYTDAAATEMKNRIEKLIGEKAQPVNIYTYHGFCNEIISQYIDEFEMYGNYRVITDSISRALIKECIYKLNPKAYRTKKNDPYYYINDIKKGIEEIKKYRLTKKQYFDALENNLDWKPMLSTLNNEQKKEELQEKINKAEELWKFYELYNEKMLNKHYIDFNDMISMVLDKFENSEVFLEKIAAQYQYIMVDEYQDTNKSQNDIVINLARICANIMVVGDDDQIIYSFQGAKLDTIENFLRKFPSTKVICLKENWRSTQNILETARKVTQININTNSKKKNNEEIKLKRLEDNPEFTKYEISKELESKNPDLDDKQNIPVQCYVYEDTEQEYNQIVQDIYNLTNTEEYRTGNKKYSEIAILTRTNKELENFAELFKIKGIPYELKEGTNIFKIKAVIMLYSYMQFLTDCYRHSDKMFKLLLCEPFSIHPKDFELIQDERSKYDCFMGAMKKLCKAKYIMNADEIKEALKNFGLLYEDYSQYDSTFDIINKFDRTKYANKDKINSFITVFNELSKYKEDEKNLKNIIIEIGSKTGIFKYFLDIEHNRIENIAGIKKLIEEAESFMQVNPEYTLNDFVHYLDCAIEDDIAITTDKELFSKNAVQLLTYHSSKGREFDYVYMPTLIRDKWESESGKKGSMKETIPLPQEEYKDKKELKEWKYSDRRNLMYVGMTRARHTLTLSYVKNLNNKNVDPSIFISAVFPEEKRIIVEKDNKKKIESIKWQLDKQTYDYKEELKSFIKSKIENLKYSPTSVNKYLKCPRSYFYSEILKIDGKNAEPDNLNYGVAVHAACQFMADEALEKNEYPSKSKFIERFNKKLEELPLSSFEKRKILMVRGADILEKYYDEITKTPISNIYAAEKVINFEINGMKNKGKIDLILKNDDGTYKICDYKTGKAKSKDDVCEGGTYENYYNQICLYKYFFEKETGYRVKDALFIFPEEFDKNLHLDLIDKDCNSVIDKFNNTIEDIKQQKFEPTPENSDCKKCEHMSFCSINII